MAGHNHSLNLDPALTKYHALNTNRYKYFRWTGRTAWYSIAYGLIVPSLLGVVAYKYEGKWDLRGKKRGDTIAEW